MTNLVEKTIGEKEIYSGRIIDVVIEEVVLPNGKKSKREIVKHPGAVAVIAITKEKKLVLVKQFRKPLNRTIVEIPAGKLEKGEDPLDCAKRELEEETGYKSNKLEHVISFYTSPGFADEIIHLYFTSELEIGNVDTDEDEFVELMEVTLEEAEELIRRREIYDAKTTYAVQFLKLKAMLEG
jgi:ADP-ribose pyrophosphatase